MNDLAHPLGALGAPRQLRCRHRRRPHRHGRRRPDDAGADLPRGQPDRRRGQRPGRGEHQQVGGRQRALAARVTQPAAGRPADGRLGPVRLRRRLHRQERRGGRGAAGVPDDDDRLRAAVHGRDVHPADVPPAALRHRRQRRSATDDPKVASLPTVAGRRDRRSARRDHLGRLRLADHGVPAADLPDPVRRTPRRHRPGPGRPARARGRHRARGHRGRRRGRC